MVARRKLSSFANSLTSRARRRGTVVVKAPIPRSTHPGKSPESGVRQEDAEKANRRYEVREMLPASQERHKHGQHQK